MSPHLDRRRRRAPRAVSALALVAVVSLPAALGAQAPQEPDLDSLRSHYLLPLPSALHAATRWRGAPGSSASTPTAFGAAWGDGFVGAGFQHRSRYGKALGTDGGVVAGFGLGDPRRALGLEVAVASLSTYRSGRFYRPALSIKAHRALPGATAVAIGVENLAVLRGTKPEGVDSWYAVATRVFNTHEYDADPTGAFTVSLGVGSGRFRAEEDVVADRGTVNVFASMGVRLAEPVSAIADWNGQDLTLAASVVPVRCLPLVVTPGLTDVTGRAGNGPRLVIGMGAGFRFADLARMEVPRCF